MAVSPPKEPYVPYLEFFRRTSSAVIARCTGYSEEPRIGADGVERISLCPGTYRFSLSDVVFGASDATFSIDQCFPPIEGDFLTHERDFNGHRSANFLDSRGGRVGNTTWGQICPTFMVGGTYLILHGDWRHSRGYEAIKTDDDLWLDVVRRAFDDLDRAKPIEMPVVDWLKAHNAIYLAEVREPLTDIVLGQRLFGEVRSSEENLYFYKLGDGGLVPDQSVLLIYYERPRGKSLSYKPSLAFVIDDGGYVDFSVANQPDPRSSFFQNISLSGQMLFHVDELARLLAQPS